MWSPMWLQEARKKSGPSNLGASQQTAGLQLLYMTLGAGPRLRASLRSQWVLPAEKIHEDSEGHRGE